MTLFENPDTNAKVIVEKNNWAQIRDRKLIHQIINQVIESDPKVVSVKLISLYILNLKCVLHCKMVYKILKTNIKSISS